MNQREVPHWGGLAILGIALAVLFGQLILQDRYLFWGLPSLQFYPWRSYAFDELSKGHFAFLNPYNGAGAPLIANYQTALFYPPNWLHLVMSDGRAMNLLAIGHVFWAGVGMWALMGRLGATSFGRSLSTLAFALTSYTLARFGSFPTIDAVAWIPWLFWGVLSVAETRRLNYLGALSLITGLFLLVGHAQTAFYAFIAAGFFTLWVVIFNLNQLPRHNRIQALTLVAIGVLLGIGIASTQLLLTLELLAESQRSGGVDYERLTNLSFAPLRVLLFVMPNFFGNPADGSYLTPGKGVYFEDAVYIGIIPLIAAMAALLGWIQRRKFMGHWAAFKSVPFWVVMVSVGSVFGMGRFTPIYQIFYDHVPTFDAFREPVRWMILPVFGLAVLAGIGVQQWGRSHRVFFWTRLSAAAGGGFVVLAIAANEFTNSDVEAVPVLIAAMIALGAWMLIAAVLTLAQPDETRGLKPMRWQLAVLLVVAIDLGWAAQGLNPTVPERYYRSGTFTEPQGRLYWTEANEEKVKFETYFDLSDYRKATNKSQGVRNSLLPNLNMLDEVAVLNNFDPLLPQYYARYLALIESQGNQADALLRAAGVGQLYGEILPEDWLSVEGENPSAISPETPTTAWIVPEAIWAEDDLAVEAAMLDPAWSPEDAVILKGEAPIEIESPLHDINFFEEEVNHSMEKRYRVMTEGSGYLVLAQSWYPGWSAKINGENAELYRANLAFMAVQVPSGTSEITVQYFPTISLPGIVMSFVALFTSIGLIGFALVQDEL